MAHIGKRSDMKDLQALTTAMLQAGHGHPVADVAQAGLDICLGIWALSGTVTREMALQVVTSQIENLFRERSN